MSSLKRVLKKLLKGNPKPDVKQPSKPKAKNPKLENRIQKVMEATGWDHKTSAKNIREAYKTYKIGSRDYVKYAFYALSDDKKEAEAKKSIVITQIFAPSWKPPAKSARQPRKPCSAI
ncbi:MAG: hypothetical protein IIU36_01790 [Firmicutes bacterium]|nr:hypothetical protein [Bacillota bacterium]